MANPIFASDVDPESDAAPDPTLPDFLNASVGRSNWRKLGDRFELTQFGVKLETILPGGQSALRHWHRKSDEFVYVMDGELVLRTNDGESVMSAGMCIGFKAGLEDGHHLVNRSSNAASFLVVGTRVRGDEAVYPDDDLRWVEVGGRYRPAHRDGTLY